MRQSFENIRRAYTHFFKFSEMTDEKLIEWVKRYPVLYDMNLIKYRDHTVRNNAWEEIAKEMKTSVEEVKDKWGKLRNCFTNALKRHRKKSGQAATKIVPWKLEKQMEFLLPHVEGRSTVTNLNDKNDDDSTQDSQLQFSEDSTLSPLSVIRSPTPGTSSSRACFARASTPISTATPRHTNKKDNDNIFLQEMVGVMKTSQEMRQKRAVPDMDETDYFFLSMSKQLKKLPKIDQAEIKFQLHKLIHESEMKMLNNRERILNTPINVTGNKTILKPLIIKPKQRSYTHIMRPAEENTQMNMIPNQTTRDLETTTLYNLNPKQILSNAISPQYISDDNSISVENEVLEVEAEQSQNNNFYLKQFYDNFGHDVDDCESNE